MSGYERMAGVIKALAHPVRLQILEIIRREGEACVCHLESMLGRRQAYISQQLSILRAAGLVVDRRKGLNVFYALAQEDLHSLLDAARQLTAAIASAEGDQLSFAGSVHTPATPCPCPRCSPAVGIPFIDDRAVRC